MHRWFNYLLEKFPVLKRISSLRKRVYAGRHRSDPAHEVQYAHDPASTGTIVVMPRERRTPASILRSFRHTSTSGAKEPARRITAVGRVSRQQVDLIATLTTAMKMVQIEWMVKTTHPPYNFTQT